jgi:hypothetical protein
MGRVSARLSREKVKNKSSKKKKKETCAYDSF